VLTSATAGQNLLASAPLVVGISGVRQNASVSVGVNGRIAAICEQERITRARGTPLIPGALPTEALDAALGCIGARPAQIGQFATAEARVSLPDGIPVTVVDHHRGHASAAFRLSPFPGAAALICDSQPGQSTSVWTGTGTALQGVEWTANDAGLAEIYARGAAVLGLPHGHEHELEALARLDANAETSRFDAALTYRDRRVHAAPGWEDLLVGWLPEPSGDGLDRRAHVAGAFQHHLGTLLLDLVRDIRTQTGERYLCLGGGLFFNTYFTTLVRQSGIFDDVFTAPNPGNAGTAVGAVLEAAEAERAAVSPFLGPAYTTEEVKATLDNCKLSYDWLTEREILDVTVDALTKGQLVGWFHGRMEWAHRALGHRSILANPLSPYALDNLNVFLKRRARHRAYGLSVPVAAMNAHFDGPPASFFMEYEARPRNPELFRHVMPYGTRTLRVQTIAEDPALAPVAAFGALHERFGQASGVPVLINTSFNGFSEPMVCSPRDAVRVFFGTGLDLLVIDRFVVRK
jgi:carbamoyltransferase